MKILNKTASAKGSSVSKKITVDTLIISDVHLGYDFCRTEKLIEVLKRYEFKQLILNGDMFEDLNFKRLHSDHWDVLSYFRQLTKEYRVVWVVGNHDGQAGILSHLLGVHVHPQYMWDSGGKKYLAIHGHQFDRFITKNIIVGGLAGKAYNLIKKVNGANGLFSQWIKENNRSWLRMSDEVAKKAVVYAKARGVDVVFCGHTHQARQDKIKGIKYFNSGCWIETPSHLITITKNKIDLVQID